jgi:hypothetical protein
MRFFVFAAGLLLSSVSLLAWCRVRFGSIKQPGHRLAHPQPAMATPSFDRRLSATAEESVGRVGDAGPDDGSGDHVTRVVDTYPDTRGRDERG